MKISEIIAEALMVDVPNEEWLQDNIDYAKQKSPDRNGLPYMGKTTATTRPDQRVSIDILKRLPGMRNEQQNVRQEDLAAIMKIMKDTGKLPLSKHDDSEYAPFINVAYDGSAWVNEGNHRIMAAAALGWKDLPVQISYFDGGERITSGPMYPGKIGLGNVGEAQISEGGWASVETQNTIITPAVLAEAVEVANKFAKEFNDWQSKQGLDLEIKMGRPKGSGTYYERDLAQDPTREYGDIDIECFIHSQDGTSSAQRITAYKSAITEFALNSPDYSTENGTNITMKTSAGAVQVDLIYTYHEHANWSRALSPEYRVKGVISTSLTSALAEVLNLSFSTQGLQVKTRNGQPVSFRQSKDTQLHTVSLDPENWAKDIYKFYYTLATGDTPTNLPANLVVHSGLKDEQRLSDIVLAIKSLGSALEEDGLLGNGALAQVANKQDMMSKISSIFAGKLEAVINSSKFDKAATPVAVKNAEKTKLMLAKYRNEIAKLLLN